VGKRNPALKPRQFNHSQDIRQGDVYDFVTGFSCPIELPA
jgi:hypothetical protein